jgi:hypothetical protein
MNGSSKKASIPEKDGGEFNVYIQFWCLHRIYETIGVGNQSLGWNLIEQAIIITLAATTAVTLSVRFLCFTILAVLIADAVKIPFIWDSEFWCNQTDLTILLAVLSTCGPSMLFFRKINSSLPSAAERSLIYESAADTIRLQMIVFYSAAAFWKLNKDFMDPHCSCAPIFPLQLLDLLWPSSLPMPSDVVWFLGVTAPTLVLLLEGGLMVGLLLRPKVGVALALVLHLGIALCPPPNNVSPFSLMCATRLVAFVPLGAARAVRKKWTLAGLAGTGLAVAVAAHLGNHEFFFDSGLPLFIALFPLMCDAVTIQPEISFPLVEKGRLKYPRLYAYGRRALLVFAVAYAYLLIPLGLQDQGQPHMYANLRMHGGSNHYLMPTALLQKAFQHSTSSLGGGVIRVESTDSKYFNEICPGDYTADMTARTKDWLHSAGHSGLMFNPMLTAVYVHSSNKSTFRPMLNSSHPLPYTNFSTQYLL